MHWTLFRGNNFSTRKIFSRGFSILPTLVVMLSLSLLCCSILAFEKRQFSLIEQKKNLFEKQLSEKNKLIEGEINVAN